MTTVPFRIFSLLQSLLFTLFYDSAKTLHKNYIIPIPGLAAGAGVSSLMIATADSVVSNVDATLVAF